MREKAEKNRRSIRSDNDDAAAALVSLNSQGAIIILEHLFHPPPLFTPLFEQTHLSANESTERRQVALIAAQILLTVPLIDSEFVVLVSQSYGPNGNCTFAWLHGRIIFPSTFPSHD